MPTTVQLYHFLELYLLEPDSICFLTLLNIPLKENIFIAKKYSLISFALYIEPSTFKMYYLAKFKKSIYQFCTLIEIFQLLFAL